MLRHGQVHATGINTHSAGSHGAKGWSLQATSHCTAWPNGKQFGTLVNIVLGRSKLGLCEGAPGPDPPRALANCAPHCLNKVPASRARGPT